jgi:hypothetical protein
MDQVCEAECKRQPQGAGCASRYRQAFLAKVSGFGFTDRQRVLIDNKLLTLPISSVERIFNQEPGDVKLDLLALIAISSEKVLLYSWMSLTLFLSCLLVLRS